MQPPIVRPLTRDFRDRRIPLKLLLSSSNGAQLKLLNASNKGTLTPGKAVKRTVVLVAGGMTAATLQFPEVHRAAVRCEV
jgi:hypothetical protein